MINWWMEWGVPWWGLRCFMQNHVPYPRVVSHMSCWKISTFRPMSCPFTKCPNFVPDLAARKVWLLEGSIITGWRFQTWILCSISYMGCHPSHWLIFFKMVKTTNQNNSYYSHGITIREATNSILVKSPGSVKSCSGEIPLSWLKL